MPSKKSYAPIAAALRVEKVPAAKLPKAPPVARSTSSTAIARGAYGVAYLDDPGRLLCLTDGELRIGERGAGTVVAEAVVGGRSAPFPGNGQELIHSRTAGVAVVRTVGCEGLLYSVRGDAIVAAGSLPGPVLALRTRGQRLFANIRGPGTSCAISNDWGPKVKTWVSKLFASAGKPQADRGGRVAGLWRLHRALLELPRAPSRALVEQALADHHEATGRWRCIRPG